MNNYLKVSLLSVFMSLNLISFSQTEIDDDDKVASPYFFVKSNNPETDALPLKSTSAKVNIAGIIADVTIIQVYKNEGENPLEAVYTFPASTNAAVYAMEMMVGDRKIIAKIEEKEKARSDYKKAKEEGKRASLLEQQRPNVFQMNVANIMPGDLITVSLKYTEILIPEEGVYEFVYPTVVGPRYSEDKLTENNSYLQTPYFHEGEDAPYDFNIDINISAGMPIQDISCKTHNVITNFSGLDKVNIKTDASEKNGGNRDFVLDYQLSGDKIANGLLLYEHGDENFFLMTIQPPKRIQNEDIPPREYIFINDVSGSMNGYPMDVSKKIMRNLVSNLRVQDRFNVLVFAGSSGWMSDKSLNASQANIDRAVKFIENQHGRGSTQILNALQKAMSLPREYEDMSRTFVIVTDGYVSVEKQVFELIRNNNDKANTFVFGIGSSVNRHLIDGMAHVGNGEAFVVLNKQDSNEKAEKFREYISNPVLTQVKTTFSGFDVYDVEPLTISDLFAERPIVIFGKYRGAAKGEIKIKGYSGKSKWVSKIDVTSNKPEEQNSALRYLWARKKIQLLDDYSSVDYSNAENTKEIVTSLGLKYNLLTNYTSFIAMEEEITNDGKSVTVKQPLPLPQNVSDYAIGYEMEILEDVEVFDEIILDKKVEILTDMPEIDQKNIIFYLENQLVPGIEKTLQNTNDLSKIEIIVNSNGNVVEIVFTGEIDPSLKLELEKKINAWTFGFMYNSGAFTFSISL